jgi:NAD-dependent DNA ligase
MGSNSKKIEIVFTGAAATKQGVGIVRADLIKHVETMGYVVAKRVSGTTKVLVASRADTVKAAKARELGVCVLTYGAFLDQFGGDVPRSGAKANPYTDKGVAMPDEAGAEYL